MNKNRIVIFLLAVVVILGIYASFTLFESLIVSLISSLVIILIYILIISQLKPKRAYTRRFDMRSIKSEIEEKGKEERKEDKKEDKKEERKEDKKEEFVSSEDSEKYHTKDCRYSKNIKGKKRQEGSREYFENKGHKPCGVCNP